MDRLREVNDELRHCSRVNGLLSGAFGFDSMEAETQSMKLFRWLNAIVTGNLRTIEMVGVLMRIFSFSLVSWLGPSSPFLFVWAFNTADAVMLSWCAIIKKDRAYTVLNVFWVGVGLVGMIRSAGFAAM